MNWWMIYKVSYCTLNTQVCHCQCEDSFLKLMVNCDLLLKDKVGTANSHHTCKHN